MKKIFIILSLFAASILTGCFDIVNESTINEDGSGIYSNTINMGSLINLLKMMGAENQLKEMENAKQDTIVSLAYLKDSIANLTDSEKILVERATLRINFNFPEEIMSITLIMPYNKQSDMITVSRLITEANKNVFKKELEKAISGPGANEQTGMGNYSLPDINEYYDYKYENSKLSRKLNKIKYATVMEDTLLKNMKEISQFGNPVTFKTIFNLPRPAKKIEGIDLKLSEDRKRVSLEATMDDFFETPEKLEYEIEY